MSVKEVLNLSILQDVARKDFFTLLSNSKDRSDRTLYLVPTLVNPFRTLGLIDSDVAKENGVKTYNVIGTDSSIPVQPTVILFAQGNPSYIDEVVQQMERITRTSEKRTFRVYFVPKYTVSCQEVLIKKFDLSNRFSVTIGEFTHDFVPLSDDVLSLELPYLMNSASCEFDPSCILYAARALYKLQALHLGSIPHIRAKGRLASNVARMMRRLSQEHSSEGVSQSSVVDSLLIFDREIDPVTPMVTQHTYEGLVDEFYGIVGGAVEVPSDVYDAEGKPIGRVVLNSTDRVFEEIQDLNISAVGQTLNQKTLSIKAVYEKRHGMLALSELRDFMKQLPEVQLQHKQVGIHTSITASLRKEMNKSEFRKRLEIEQCIISGEGEKEIYEYLDDCICRCEPFHVTLRLMCMLSHCSPSWKQKTYEHFRESMVQSYGAVPVLMVLSQLEKTGFLRKPEAKNTFIGSRKTFHLFVPNCNELNPDNIAYVYSGYAPLTLRLIELATRTRMGWKTMEQVLSTIPGDSFSEDCGNDIPGNIRVVFVMFIGGVTFAEISALRFLSTRDNNEGVQIRYIVMTTQIINGRSLMNTILPAPLPTLN